MLIAVMIILCTIVLRIASYYIMLWEFVDPSDIWMKYDQFRAIYSVDPTHFQLYNFQECGPCIRYTGDVEKYYYIYFKRISDWIRAKILLNRVKIVEENNERIKSTLQFIEVVKSKISNE